MPSAVQVGSILIEKHLLMSQALALESEPYSGNWNLVKGLDAFTLDRQIRAAGWNFFFMAADVKVSFFGAISAEKIHHALQRIREKVKLQHFNGLEITGIAVRHFLGLPYATVSAHSRHIQQGCQLDGIAQRQATRRAAESPAV